MAFDIKKEYKEFYIERLIIIGILLIISGCQLIRNLRLIMIG